jgi:RND superfamily putative drug exporter
VTRLSSFVVRHRALVSIFWLLAFVAGAATASGTVDRLKFDFSLPGQPGDATEKAVLAAYGNGGTNAPLLPVVTVPEGTTVTAEADAIASVFQNLRTTFPTTRVHDLRSTGDRTFVTADDRSTFALVMTPLPQGFQPGIETEVAPFLEREAARTGFTTGLTGYNMLASGGETEGPSVLVETLVAAAGALLVLAFVFASFLALIPMLVAAVSILSTFLVLLGLTYLTDVSFVVQFLVSLIGLGVAIDYSLLVVNRWREERDKGADNVEAVHLAMATAGHAVLASALTVAISLAALVVLPVPFLRSMGLGGMLIPLVSTGVVLTLLPAFLSKAGPAFDRPRLRHEEHASRPWSAWARGVIRFRWPAALLALVVLGLLALPLTDVKVGLSRSESLASSGPAYDTLKVLRDGGVTTGFLTPLEVLSSGSDTAAAATSAQQVAEGVRSVDGVTAAFASADNLRGTSAITSVIPDRETVDIADSKVVEQVSDAADDVAGFQGVAGTGALVLDYRDAVYAPFPLVLALIALVTFLLLVRAFRSVLLPLKAVVLNLLSLAATFGATVFFWQQGHGSDTLFGVAGTGAITFWLPIIIFAFLFGLSMDYEVFILARMREEYDATGSTPQAIAIGLGRTGRLVTSAALILFLSFVALSSAPNTDIKVLGTALGFGILLDATVVRALLVPALVSLFGSWNWWLPAWLATVLRVQPSPRRPETVAGQAGEAEPVLVS